MKKFLLSIFAVLFAFAGVQAQELVYTLTPAAGSQSSYNGNCDIEINGITWNLEGNATMIPWRIGGKQITNQDRALYSKTSMDAAVDKVVVTSGANTITVNSAKLLVADNGDFTNAVEYSFNLVASGSVEIPVTAKAGSYYKFVFNVTNTAKSSNKYILFSEAKFYGTAAGGGENPEPEEPVVPEEPETPEDGIVWNLVEDVNDIKAGDEVIIVADGYDVALGALSGSIHTSTPVTVSGNTLTDTGDAIVLTIGKNGDYYTFSYDSKYLNWTSGNSMNTAVAISDNTSFTIAIEEGVTTISNVAGVSEGRELQYNAGSPRFACYKGTQQSVCIYKKTELLYNTLTVTNAGWATLYLPTTARIPSTIEAYTVTAVNSGWVSLTQVTGVIPANTGIIVKAAAGNYNFFIGETATADVEDNLLSGSAYPKNIEEEAYVLGNVGGVVGLYKAEMNQLEGTAWLNNAFKAYLPASAVPNKTAEFYGFDWDGTTGIEEITDNREQSTAIYDLTGRRVEAITAPGIYIVNGVKRVVR